MVEIIRNLFFFAVWVVLSGGLAVGIHKVYADGVGTVGVLMWLVGQMVILSPMLWILWRDRAVGSADE